MTVARQEGWPPAFGPAALPGVEALTSWQALAPGAGRAMGMVVGPGAPQANAANTPRRGGSSQAYR